MKYFPSLGKAEHAARQSNRGRDESNLLSQLFVENTDLAVRGGNASFETGRRTRSLEVGPVRFKTGQIFQAVLSQRRLRIPPGLTQPSNPALSAASNMAAAAKRVARQSRRIDRTCHSPFRRRYFCAYSPNVGNFTTACSSHFPSLVGVFQNLAHFPTRISRRSSLSRRASSNLRQGTHVAKCASI